MNTDTDQLIFPSQSKLSAWTQTQTNWFSAWTQTHTDWFSAWTQTQTNWFSAWTQTQTNWFSRLERKRDHLLLAVVVIGVEKTGILSNSKAKSKYGENFQSFFFFPPCWDRKFKHVYMYNCLNSSKKDLFLISQEGPAMSSIYCINGYLLVEITPYFPISKTYNDFDLWIFPRIRCLSGELLKLIHT